MAWKLTITPISISEKTVKVSATRTDDTDESTFTTTTTGKVDTAANKTAILDAIWSDWQKYSTRQTNIASMIGDLESSGVSNLEARE